MRGMARIVTRRGIRDWGLGAAEHRPDNGQKHRDLDANNPHELARHFGIQIVEKSVDLLVEVLNQLPQICDILPHGSHRAGMVFQPSFQIGDALFNGRH